MANNDGSIVIGVEFDTTPVAKGYQKIENCAKSAQNVIASNFKNAGKVSEEYALKLDKAAAKVDNLNAKLKQMENGGAAGAKLTSEIEKQTQKIAEMSAEYDQMRQGVAELNAEMQRAKESSGVDSEEYRSAADALKVLTLESDQTAKNIQTAKEKLAEMNGELAQTKAASRLSPEYDELAQKLEFAQREYDILAKKAEESGNKQEKSIGKVEKALNRVSNLAKSAFVFNGISKAFRGLSDTVSKYVQTNTEFVNALKIAKGNLLTAFQPILTVVMPILTRLGNALVHITNLLANFVAMLSGKSVNELQQQAKATKKLADSIGKTTNATEKSTKATKKATKAEEEQNQALANFDTLNVLSTESKSDSESEPDNDNDIGASSVGVSGTDDALFETQTVTTLETIKGLVTTIGAILAGWTVINLLKQLPGLISELIQTGNAANLTEQLKNTAGTLMIIAGVAATIVGFADAWVNGLDWGNFATVLSGIALTVGGLGVVFGAMGAVIGLLVGSIAAFVLGIKDILTNGATLQNVLLVIIGIIGAFVAVMYLANAPIALIVAAILGVIAVFVTLWNKSEAFRNFWIELWEKIKTAAGTAWENIKTVTSTAWENIKKTVDIGWTAIKTGAKKLWEKLKEIGGKISGIFTSLWNDHLKPFWEDHVKPMIDAIKEAALKLWDNTIKPVVENIKTGIKDLWDNILTPIGTFLKDTFQTAFETCFEAIKTVVSTVVESIKGFLGGIETALSGVCDFITGVFTGDWDAALNGLKDVLKGVVNGIISLFEGMINAVVRPLNTFLGKISEAANALGDLIGKDWNVNLKFAEVHIPRLATGAVIPPNKEFLAVLGDQKRGTNIEAPLDTMVAAFKEAASGMGGGNDINVTFSGNEGQLLRYLYKGIKVTGKKRGVQFVK